MNTTYPIIPIQFCYLFEESSKHVTDYLKLIPREFAVRYALLISNCSEGIDWTDQLNILRVHDSVKWVFMSKMVIHELELPKVRYVLFTPLTGLELLKYILAIPAYEHKPNGYEWQGNLIKAITLINTELLADGPHCQDSSFNRFCKSVRHFRYEMDDRVIFYAAVYRAMCLLDFLENGDSIISKDLRTELTKKLNFDSIRGYIKHRLYLLNKLDVKPKIKNQIFRLKDNFQGLERDTICYNEEIILEKNKDYTEFKIRPFIQINKGNFAVVRNTFVANMIYNKLKFALIDCYKKFRNGSAQEFLGKFNKDFIEEVLFIRILKYSFKSNKYICFSENECKQRIIELKKKNNGVIVKNFEQRLMDGYVRFENKILLLECKGKIISLNAIYDKAQLRKDIENDIVGQEGTGQLIDYCERIFNNESLWDEDIPENYVIYPMLILDDIGFSAEGFSQYVIESTKEFVNQHSECVYPFTVLDMDTFILISELIRSNILEIFRVIEDYHKHINNSVFEEKEISFATYLRAHYETRSPKVVVSWLSQLFQKNNYV